MDKAKSDSNGSCSTGRPDYPKGSSGPDKQNRLDGHDDSDELID